MAAAAGGATIKGSPINEEQVSTSVELRPDLLPICKKVQSAVQALAVFDNMVLRAEYIRTYSSSSDGRKIACCRALTAELNAQIDYSQFLIDKNTNVVSVKRARLEKLHAAQSAAAEKQIEMEKEIAKVEAKMSKNGARLESTLRDIYQCEHEMRRHEREMQKQRHTRVMGAAHVASMFSLEGLKATASHTLSGPYRAYQSGDVTEAIPGYEIGAGVYSIATLGQEAAKQQRDKAEAEKLDLESEVSQIRTNLTVKREGVRGQQVIRDENMAQIAILDQEIKQLGSVLTKLFRVQTPLKLLVVKHDLLKFETEMTGELLLAGIQEIDFVDFLKELRSSKLEFQKIESKHFADAFETDPGAGAAESEGTLPTLPPAYKEVESTTQALAVCHSMIARTEYLSKCSSSDGERNVTCCRALAVELRL